MKNNLNKILGVFLLVLFLLTSWNLYKKIDIEKSVQKAKQSISETDSLLYEYEEEDFESTVLAKELETYLDESTLSWASVISKILDTVPENSSGEKIVNILSYSASFGNEISLSISTDGDSNTPYNDIVKFISAFDESDYFVDSFLPSVAFGLNTEGKEVLTFSFQTKFEEVLDYGEEKNPIMR